MHGDRPTSTGASGQTPSLAPHGSPQPKAEAGGAKWPTTSPGLAKTALFEAPHAGAEPATAEKPAAAPSITYGESHYAKLPQFLKSWTDHVHPNDPSRPAQIMIATDAHRIATHLGSTKAFKAYERAIRSGEGHAIPGVEYERHSGGSLGAAEFLAREYLKSQEPPRGVFRRLVDGVRDLLN